MTTETDMLLRLLAAVGAGAVVGLEREVRSKPAGLRTLALVGLGSALVTLACLELPQGQNTDPLRAVQGIVVGIGFLGAGVIMRRQDELAVHGLTTAATIWVAAALGIAFGMGRWVMASTALGLAVFVLVVLDWVESRFRPRGGHP